MTTQRHTPETDYAAARRHRTSADQADGHALAAQVRASRLAAAASSPDHTRPYADALLTVARLQEAIADAWREAAHTLRDYAADYEAHARGQR